MKRRIERLEVLPADGALYVRVTCDDGTTGVGESTFFGWPQAAGVIAGSFASALIGADPFDVEHLGLSLYRSFSFRGMAVSGAISAVDQALWDIKVKVFDEPVWRLLGGEGRTSPGWAGVPTSVRSCRRRRWSICMLRLSRRRSMRVCRFGRRSASPAVWCRRT